MGRANYVCTTCSEHFTRKYSAKRHNITVHHNNGGEIVPLVEYLGRRSSGRYQPSHPSSYRRRSDKSTHTFERAMVADSVGDRPGALQRQRQEHYQYHEQSSPALESLSSSPAAIQDQPLGVSPYPTDPTFQSQPVSTSEDDQTTTLSQETRLKIAELKRLIYRYSQNPAAVINCIIYYCNNGDNTLLDEKLEQLRSIDAISK